MGESLQLDYTTLYAGSGISAFGLSALVLTGCAILRHRGYILLLGLGMVAIGIACTALCAYRWGGGPWLGLVTIVGLMSSFLLIHSAMSQYVGNEDMSLVDWAMIPALILCSTIYVLGWDGLAFMLCFVITAGLILDTSHLYWSYRKEVPYLMHSMAALGVSTAILFVLRAYALAIDGQWVIGVAPNTWAENLTAILALLLITGFGPLIVAFYHARDRVALITDAVTDALTGLRNRRALVETFEGRQFSPSMAVIMFDLDHFKRTNDMFGHQVGDDVLRRFAHMIAQCEGPEIMGFRLGGEEFAVVVLRGGVNLAYDLANRIGVAFSREVVRTKRGPLRSTVSGGVAAGSAASSRLNELLAQADAALYEAKRNGRNQIFRHGQTVPDATNTAEPQPDDRQVA